MPLIAMLDAARVDARRFTPQAWSELQQSEERRRMLMPLCGVRAVAKTLGSTQFFAHYRKIECKVDHGGESPQHMAMKTALAERVDRVPGWHAVLEHPHPSREWIIDVLAESDDGRRRIAFEVQLSSQTPDDYSRRSQRYFNDRVFPVWIVPRHLESSRVLVPVVVTGFAKSTALPEQPADLMDLDISVSFADQDTLGEFVDEMLRHGHRWSLGSPSEQIRRHEVEQERAERERQELALREKQFQERIREMNLNSAPPEVAYGAHTIHTEGGPFVWATMTACWNCEYPMLLWEGLGTRIGDQHRSAPSLAVKSTVGQKRYENHPDVHKAVDRWICETRADVRKAGIKLRRSKMKGSEYSAFVCPDCEAIMGQMFISCIRTDRWSLISAPLLKTPNAVPGPRAQRPSDPRRGKPQKNKESIQPVVERPPFGRTTVPEELQTDRRKTWAELHSPEGVAEARRKFMGTRGT